MSTSRVSDIRVDLRNAGAEVIEDQPVVSSGNLVTSRDPNDLGHFSKAIEDYLKNARRRARFSSLHSGASVLCAPCRGTGTLRGGPGLYPYRCGACRGTGRVATNQPPASTDH